jgi:hypothetical protein
MIEEGALRALLLRPKLERNISLHLEPYAGTAFKYLKEIISER